MTTSTQHTQPAIGWIGLGKMGTPIVRNLLKAGFPVTVFDVDTDRVAELEAQGAKSAASIAELGKSASILFSIIPDDAVLLKVALGESGVVAHAAPDAVYVDMSTVSPAASVRVRDAARVRGIAYIGAPVSGSTVLAEKALLTVFASGPRKAYERIQPVLAALSAKQYYVGTDEQARYLKLAINHLVGSTAVLLGEALTLGRKGGLDWVQMLDVIGDSVVASPLVKYKLDPLRKRDFSAAFSARQMLKDMSLVVAAGQDAGVPMAAAELVRDQFSVYASGDGGELDFFSILRAVEAGAHLQD
ncbi:MAG TPA: NAD(P)-dependent oxidoreductase [Pararobbsia sp.]|nr:NAD(P)-dependent oxidoreductase [Pararobbsia sp.]